MIVNAPKAVIPFILFPCVAESFCELWTAKKQIDKELFFIYIFIII